jgi:uncharacterized protein YkwD
MNYIDTLLLIILVASVWSGIRKGFILGLTDLFIWLGGLFLSFWFYPFSISLIKYFDKAPSIWVALLTFLVTMIGVRIVLGYLAEKVLVALPTSVHQRQLNKISGVLPGLISGLLYVAITILLFLSIPLSAGISQKTQESKVVGLLSGKLDKVQASLQPLLEDVNRSLNTLTIKPGSEKFVKLPYKVSNPTPRPDLEAEMLELVNAERKKEGLQALKADPELRLVARLHSKDMFARSYFSHISPEGATPFDRIRKAEISFLTAGENLALAQSLHLAHTGLMNSPGHKANILHKSFGRVGIGILDGGIYGIMVTQNFRN